MLKIRRTVLIERTTPQYCIYYHNWNEGHSEIKQKWQQQRPIIHFIFINQFLFSLFYVSEWNDYSLTLLCNFLITSALIPPTSIDFVTAVGWGGGTVVHEVRVGGGEADWYIYNTWLLWSAPNSSFLFVLGKTKKHYFRNVYWLNIIFMYYEEYDYCSVFL